MFLAVIPRPPKDLALRLCKDVAGLTAKTQGNEVKSVQQPNVFVLKMRGEGVKEMFNAISPQFAE
jgi:hypothetical protein